VLVGTAAGGGHPQTGGPESPRTASQPSKLIVTDESVIPPEFCRAAPALDRQQLLGSGATGHECRARCWPIPS